LSGKQSRFSFLTGRRGSPSQPQNLAPVPSSPGAESELLEQLERERALRAKAEEKARRQDSEIEELSVQLFSQANEMVAAERKARAKLEARVEQLELKDKEKMARLERLEKAVSRIDRVKAMLAAPPAHRKP
jgi:predicted RNase H-like nuclease (RuvC/YqgF family)